MIFEIIEGPQVNVKKVVIHGNQNLPKTGWWFWEDGLEHLASTELDGPSLFDWNGKELVEAAFIGGDGAWSWLATAVPLVWLLGTVGAALVLTLVPGRPAPSVTRGPDPS